MCGRLWRGFPEQKYEKFLCEGKPARPLAGALLAYNLKKYLKFVQKQVKSGAGTPLFIFTEKITFLKMIKPFLSDSIIRYQLICYNQKRL